MNRTRRKAAKMLQRRLRRATCSYWTINPLRISSPEMRELLDLQRAFNHLNSQHLDIVERKLRRPRPT